MSIRRIIQIISVLFFNFGLFIGRVVPQLRLINCPVLNCDGCFIGVFACPIGMLQRFAAIQSFDYIAGGTLLAVGIIMGKMVCGYICPFGFFQDMLAKVPVKKRALPDWTKYIKYIVLIVCVGWIPYKYGMMNRLTFCYICPAGTLTAHLPLVLTGKVAFNFIKIGLLAVFLGGAVFYKRFFCRLFCPVNTVYGILNLYSFYQMKFFGEKCTKCLACEPVCPADVKFHENSRHEDCARCHECKKACKFDAIR